MEQIYHFKLVINVVCQSAASTQYGGKHLSITEHWLVLKSKGGICFHMVYFSWIPQINARLKLSCKLNQNVIIIIVISHWRLHMARIMSLMST